MAIARKSDERKKQPNNNYCISSLSQERKLYSLKFFK